MADLAGVCAVVRHQIYLYEASRHPGNLDFLIYQVSKLFRILLAVTQVLDVIGQGLAILILGIQSSCSLTSVEGYVPEIVTENRRGRPRLNITKQQMEYLLDLGFSCSKIAGVIGVSLSTIRRRMLEYVASVVFMSLCRGRMYSLACRTMSLR